MLYNLFENRDFVSVFAVALLAEGVDRNYNGKAWVAMTGNVDAVGLLDNCCPTRPPSEMMMGGDAPPSDWAATSRPILRRVLLSVLMKSPKCIASGKIGLSCRKHIGFALRAANSAQQIFDW